MSPFVQKLALYKKRLESHGYNVVYELPNRYTEPIIVISTHRDDPFAARNGAVYRARIAIDYFCDDTNGRISFENDVYNIRLLIQERDISSRITKETLTNRDVYHANFEITTFIK